MFWYYMIKLYVDVRLSVELRFYEGNINPCTQNKSYGYKIFILYVIIKKEKGDSFSWEWQPSIRNWERSEAGSKNILLGSWSYVLQLYVAFVSFLSGSWYAGDLLIKIYLALLILLLF